MKNLLNRIKNWRNISFVQDTAIMQLGAIFSTAINVAASVIFARILMPERYGVYALAFAFSGIIFLFMNFGVNTATSVLLSRAYADRNKDEVKNILTYFFKMNFLVAILVGGIAIAISPFLTKYFYGSVEVGNLARIVIATTIFGLFFNLTDIILQISLKIKSSVVFNIIKEIVKIIFSLTALFLGFGVIGILFGQLFATIIMSLASIVIYKFYFLKIPIIPSFKEIILNWNKISIKNYFNFGFFIALDKNISSLYSLLPILFLGMFFSIEKVGYFNIALKYITIPLILLSPVASLLNTRLPRMQNKKGESMLARNFFKVSLVSGSIATALTVPTLLLGPYLIKFFYGDAYIESVRIVYYLSLLPVFSGFSVGLGSIFKSVNKVWVAITINSTIIIVGTLPVFHVIKRLGLPGIAIVAVVWPMSSYIISFIYFRKKLK